MTLPVACLRGLNLACLDRHGVVLAFVLIRAASFHHIDRFIDARILGLKWNWVVEMGGISIVLVASQWRDRTAPSKTP